MADSASDGGRRPPEMLECELILQDPGTGNGPYRVLALTPAGPAVAEFKSPEKEKEEFTRLLDDARSDDADLESRRKLGRLLFQALVPEGAVRQVWDNTQGRLAAPNTSLRLRLWIEPPAFSDLPWELLCAGEQFLAARANVHLSRYLPGLEPRYLAAAPRVRVLVVVAEGEGLTPIDQTVLAKLRTALEDLVGRENWKELRNPEVADVLAELREGYHVLHFVGHGRAGAIAWVLPNGKYQALTADQLGQLVLGQQQLRLVVLNACGSAEPGVGERFKGVGQTLVRCGIPAVVAMQYPEVLQATAGVFNREFYRALRAGVTVDEAVTAGRQALSVRHLEQRDWSTPVLYLGTRLPGGIRLGGTETEGDPWGALREATAASLRSREALQAVTGGLRELARPLRRMERLLTLRGELDAAQREWTATESPLADLERRGVGPANDDFQRVGKAWRALKTGPMTRIVALQAQGEEAGKGFAGWPAAAAELDRVLENWSQKKLIQAVGAIADCLARAEEGVFLALVAASAEAVNLAHETLNRVPTE